MLTIYTKDFECVDHSKLCDLLNTETEFLLKFFNRWEYQSTLPISWKTNMVVKKQQVELDMEQQTGSKLKKEYGKAAYCHPACLTYMQKYIMQNVRMDES